MKALSKEQLTGEWFAARVGKVTASRVHDVMAKSKRDGKPLKARSDYMTELVIERLTGETFEHYVSPAMERGLDLEADAISEYELSRDVQVVRVGFVAHPLIEQAGASPDGLVDDDGLIEVKCPEMGTHMETLLSGRVPPKYYAQMQWQMICTERLWCDYGSYDPRFPPELRLFVKRIFWDDQFVPEAEAAVMDFLREVDDMVARLKVLGR